MRIIATVKIDFEEQDLDNDATEQEKQEAVKYMVVNGCLEYAEVKEVIIAG